MTNNYLSMHFYYLNYVFNPLSKLQLYFRKELQESVVYILRNSIHLLTIIIIIILLFFVVFKNKY